MYSEYFRLLWNLCTESNRMYLKVSQNLNLRQNIAKFLSYLPLCKFWLKNICNLGRKIELKDELLEKKNKVSCNICSFTSTTVSLKCTLPWKLSCSLSHYISQHYYFLNVHFWPKQFDMLSRRPGCHNSIAYSNTEGL